VSGNAAESVRAGWQERFAIAALFAIGSIPLAMRRSFARLVGALVALVPTRERTIAELQIRDVLRPSNPSAVLKGVYQNLCLTVVESLNLFPILERSDELIRFDGWEDFRTYTESKKGVVCLTGHVGNWDLLAAYMRKQQVDFYALGRIARGTLAQAVLAAIRERYRIRTLWRQDRAGIKQIVRELRSGGAIAALIDQDTNVSSEFVPFFDRAAKTPSALVEMGRKLDCLMCSIFMVRDGSGGYQILAYPLDATKSTVEILAEFNARLEDVIRRYPDQWVWFHKRWRSRPDGTVFSSRAYIDELRQNPQRFALSSRESRDG
jgi:KDO2-lipid IV(A) lauroyltransferase